MLATVTIFPRSKQILPMSLKLKRTLSTNEGHISPPPPIRRKFARNEPSESEPPFSLPEKHLRIFSWNVNGVGAFLQRQISFSKTTPVRSPLRVFLARHNWPHILCLQEVKISPKDTATQRALQHAANLDSPLSTNTTASELSLNPTYTIHFSLPRDKYNATGFGGKVHGVATLIRDDLAASLSLPALICTTRLVDWDLEGRVLITTISIPATPPTTSSLSPNPLSSPPATNPAVTTLSILHAYWPNGTTNPYYSPLTGLPQGTRHTHKLNFHTHMLSEALSLQSQSTSTAHHYVLLIGDMNIAPQRIDGYPNLRTFPEQHVINRKDFNDKFLSHAPDEPGEKGFGGIDVYRHLHGSERKYTYFPRSRKWGESCDRVDLVVAGRSLIEGSKQGEGDSHGQEKKAGAIIGMEIHDTPLERGHSDHVPLSVTVDLGRLI